MLKPVVKLISALNGNLKKEQIAAGFSWGLLLGLIPAGNAIWILFFAASFFFKHHHGSTVLFMALVKLFLGLLNPLLDVVGWEILHVGALQEAFISFYNMPLVPLTKFNNTLVAGGLCLGLALWIPVYVLFLFVIPLYRNAVVPKIRNSPVVKAVLKFPLFSALEKLIKTASAGE